MPLSHGHHQHSFVCESPIRHHLPQSRIMQSNDQSGSISMRHPPRRIPDGDSIPSGNTHMRHCSLPPALKSPRDSCDRRQFSKSNLQDHTSNCNCQQKMTRTCFVTNFNLENSIPRILRMKNQLSSKLSTSLILILISVLFTITTAHESSQVINPSLNNVLIKCDFEKYPIGGCSDHLTSSCNIEQNICDCRPGYPVQVNGRCFAFRDISDLCVTTRQCIKIKAKCIDNNNQEVTSNEEQLVQLTTIKQDAESKQSSQAADSGSSSLSASNSVNPGLNSSIKESNQRLQSAASIRLTVGICKCSEGSFYNHERRECSPKILGKRCFFNTDCFSRSHSYCDGSKCKCKSGFFGDLITDECKPSLATLCVYGAVNVNGTQRCRPSPRLIGLNNLNSANQGSPIGDDSIVNGGFDGPIRNQDQETNHRSANSSVSALFWPVIAFFLVILLLRMLKEGMKRDCERVLGHNNQELSSDHSNSSSRRRNINSSSNSSSSRIRNPRSHHRTSSGLTSRPFIRHYPLGSELVSSSNVHQIGSGVPLPPGLIEIRRNSSSSNNNNHLIQGTSLSNSNSEPEIIVLMPPPPYSPNPTNGETNNNQDQDNHLHHLQNQQNNNSHPHHHHNNTTSVIIPECPPSYEEATRK